jgi:hypothetical protein
MLLAVLAVGAFAAPAATAPAPTVTPAPAAPTPTPDYGLLSFSLGYQYDANINVLGIVLGALSNELSLNGAGLAQFPTSMNNLVVSWYPISLITVQARLGLMDFGANNVTMGETGEPNQTVVNNLSLNLGSIGLRGLVNLERPTPNSKFYVGAGLDYWYLTAGLNVPEGSETLNVSGGANGLNTEVFAGFEWRPKDIPNLGLYAEVGYDMFFLGNMTLTEAEGSHSTTLTLSTNGYWGQTVWALGADWHI